MQYEKISNCSGRSCEITIKQNTIHYYLTIIILYKHEYTSSIIVNPDNRTFYILVILEQREKILNVCH